MRPIRFLAVLVVSTTGFPTGTSAAAMVFDFPRAGPGTGLEVFPGFGFTFLGTLEAPIAPALVQSVTFNFSDYEDAFGGGPGSGPDFSFVLLSFGAGGGVLDFGPFPGAPGVGSLTLTGAAPGFAAIVTDLTTPGGSLFGYEAVDLSGFGFGGPTGVGSFSLAITPIPEPGSLVLLTTGLAGSLFFARGRSRKRST